MKLKDFKEYINSLPSDMDDLEVLTSYYDMEKGQILRDVEGLCVIRYKEEEKTYVDSFDRTVYTSIVKEETLNCKNSSRALTFCFYRNNLK